MIWTIIGWLSWAVAVFVAITFAIGTFMYLKKGESVQFRTMEQGLCCGIVAVLFLVFAWNKLHIIWLIPLIFLFPDYRTFIRTGKIK